MELGRSWKGLRQPPKQFIPCSIAKWFFLLLSLVNGDNLTFSYSFLGNSWPITIMYEMSSQYYCKVKTWRKFLIKFAFCSRKLKSLYSKVCEQKVSDIWYICNNRNVILGKVILLLVHNKARLREKWLQM